MASIVYPFYFDIGICIYWMLLQTTLHSDWTADSTSFSFFTKKIYLFLYPFMCSVQMQF